LWCARVSAGEEAASASLIKTISVMSDRRTAYDRAIDALQQTRDTATAIQHFETWLAAVPSDTNAANLLARCYEATGHFEEAAFARQVRPIVQRVADDRTRSVFTPQVRMGTYRVLLPVAYKPTGHYPAVLVLHGNGQNPDVMIDWVRTMHMDSVIFIFPQAPYAKVTEIMQTQRRKFSASGDGLDFPDSIMIDIVDESASWYHDALLDAETRFAISKVKPVVIGFSQGGFYAHILTGRFPATFQGVVSISASMWEYGRIAEYLPKLHPYGIEALILHGKKDTSVPLQTAELYYAMLKGAGIAAEFKSFDGGHWPSDEATTWVKSWLQKRLH